MANPFLDLGNRIAQLASRVLGRRIMTTVGQWFSLTTPEVYASIDQKNAIKEGFSANIAVYVCVKKDAEKFANIPRYVYDAKKIEEKAIRKQYPILETKAYTKLTGAGSAQKLTDLINRPNPYQSQDAFYGLARASYKTCGEAFIWLNRGDLEQYRQPDGTFDDKQIDRLPVLEMYVLPPDYITVIPDPANVWGIVGYYLEAGERVFIRAGDVVHWKDLNLTFDASSRPQSRGMSPLTPGARNLAENNSLVNGSMRMAQNDGARAILFNETLSSMSPQQQTDLKRVIDAKVNNNDVAGAVATLQGKWGVANLAVDARAMQMIERKRFTWHEIALLFGIPPGMVDTEQKYDNAGQDAIDWVSNSIIPACKTFDGEMNRVLMKAFGLEGLAFIGSDWTSLPEIQSYMVRVAKELQEIWSITPNEIRDVLGYEKREEPEYSEPWPVSTRSPRSDASDGMEAEEEIIRAYGRREKNNGALS